MLNQADIPEKLISVTPTVDLSIVIVNYNTLDLLRKCLQSVIVQTKTEGELEIIVIDNASSDGSIEMVRREFPAVKLISNSDNKGFAAANNQGIRIARGQYVVLLNSDAELLDNALWKMTAFLDAHPTAGAVGAHLVYADGSFQEGAFRFPSLMQILVDFFPLNWRLVRSRLNGRYPRQLYDGEHPRAFEIDFPLGACLMMRRAALEQVGLLDEHFWMYMEEIDWCYRVKHANPAPGYTPRFLRFRPGRRVLQTWSIYCMPSAKVLHHGGGSSKPFRDELFFQLHKSRVRFYQKHYSARFIRMAKILNQMGLNYLSLAVHWQAWRGIVSKETKQSRLKAYQRVKELYK